MEMKQKMSQLVAAIRRMGFLKYVVVAVAGVAFVGFLDGNSVWAHLRNKQRIGQLNEEIGYYGELNKRNQEQIHQIENNPKAVERIARERYFMKAADEDIFVLSDDMEPTDTRHEAAH